MSAATAGLLHYGVQDLLAGPLAVPAGLGADPAVLVHHCMPLALVAGALAGGHADLQQRPGAVGVVLPLAAGGPDSGGADIGETQAQPDSHDQLRYVRLGSVI